MNARLSHRLSALRFTLLLAAAALVGLAGGGCSNPTTLKPSPVIYGPGHLDVAELVPEAHRTPDVQVFYATNRTAKGPDEDRKYTNSVDKTLHLGAATVRLGGRDATWDQIRAASAGSKNNLAFRMTKATELGRLAEGDDSTDAFTQAIDQQLDLSPDRQVNVYVHGFRTNVAMEVELLAKLQHYTGRRGAFVCFAWPARQSLMLYGSDTRRGMASAHYLADLLELLAKQTKADRINVMGYSAGAAVTADALCQLRDRYAKDDASRLSKELRIGNIIFAASDIDLDTFRRDQFQRIQALGQNTIIYISKNDAALGLASFGQGVSRLGRPDVSKLHLTEAEVEEAARDSSLQVVDVTDVPGPHASGGGFGGHGYWYANPWVMTDLLVTLRWQTSADERGLVRKSGQARWYFPKDYPQRINESVLRFANPTTAPATAPATSTAMGHSTSDGSRD